MTGRIFGLSPAWLMLAGFIVGFGAGLAANLFAGPEAARLVWVVENVTGPIGEIFLRLLFMLVLPLLFSALVTGVAEIGDLRALGRIGWRTLVLTAAVSAIAVGIGLGMVNWLQPGSGLDPEAAERLIAQSAAGARGIAASAPQAVEPSRFLLELIPQNVFAAASQNLILPVMVFALVFGIGVAATKGPAVDQLKLAVAGLFEVMMTLIGFVIRLAPIAVACLMFNLAALFGWELLARLAAYVAVAAGAMALHMFVVYPLLVFALARRSPIAFFAQIREPMVVAFSTASSNATLPVSLRAAETELKLPQRVARFVLTIGATANQNGTALFEGVTVLFLAQVFGIELSLAQQAMVMGVCILGGIGTAGVPAGSLPVVAMILGMVGVPVEAIGLVLGVDRFLDMCRTTLNVTGDLVVATIVARTPGERDEASSAP